MKISFDLNDSNRSGKHKFISRLKKELIYLGYQEVNNNSNSDIHLFVDKPNLNSKINVFRLDGVWFNESIDFNRLNESILYKLKLSAGVIYQNEFCKKAVENFIHYYHPKYKCIFNGASINEFDVKPHVHDKPYFMALCKWRPHKRLRDIINGFLASQLEADLVIFGEPDYKIKNKNIIYHNWQSSDILAEYLKGCLCSVHLCWVDWCPNSVVESLIAGKQVLHVDSGGTPYIVKNRGYKLEDIPWDFKSCKMYDPPKLDINILAELYRKSYYDPIINFDIKDLEIKNIAKQYDEFFKELV